jgi:hypothetical protein
MGSPSSQPPVQPEPTLPAPKPFTRETVGVDVGQSVGTFETGEVEIFRFPASPKNETKGEIVMPPSSK